MPQKAWILRIKPSGIDRVPESLNDKEIIIGWSEAPELLNDDLSWYEFRNILHNIYHSDDPDYRKSGLAAGNMRRFIREMQEEDFVIVPYYNSTFYIATIQSKAFHRPEKVADDTAFRRKVKWFNNGKHIPRGQAGSKLQSRMKSQGTCVEATDLIDEIKIIIQYETEGIKRDFVKELKENIQKTTLNEIQKGVMNEREFEKIIADLLVGLGAKNVEVRDYRPNDFGADIIADVDFANKFTYKLAVQCKYYRPEPPVGKKAIDELISGILEEEADFGWLVTSGTIEDELYDYVEKQIQRIITEQVTSKFIKIELIDGMQLSALIVESGIRGLLK